MGSGGQMSEIRVVHSAGREGWSALVDPPGQIPSAGGERDLFTSEDGPFTTGFWEREPDTWSFERPYDEVALILSGSADIETDDGQMLPVGPGDVLDHAGGIPRHVAHPRDDREVLRDLRSVSGP